MEPVIYLRKDGILSRKDTASKIDQKTVQSVVDDESGTDVFAVSAGSEEPVTIAILTWSGYEIAMAVSVNKRRRKHISSRNIYC
ncbi:hypothetical protein A2U01_0031865 [Trifolium medium]|uniref:Uncharacterized protein n=1 Tax=Trifolium medium TaxID=97028 RepID=A0A392PH13_9FABA|nr:hypothetical protein [Trifolium medium]